MPDHPSEDEEKIISRAHVCQVKTNGVKKALRKQVHLLLAKKKEYVSKNMTAPDELLSFLRDERTLEEVLNSEDVTMLRR